MLRVDDVVFVAPDHPELDETLRDTVVSEIVATSDDREAVLLAKIDGFAFRRLKTQLSARDLDVVRAAIVSTYRTPPAPHHRFEKAGRDGARTTKPLPSFLLKTFEAYLPQVLGVTDPVFAPLVPVATQRLNAYVMSTPPWEGVWAQIASLLGWTFAQGLLFGRAVPWEQPPGKREAFVARLYRSDQHFWLLENVLGLLRKIPALPTQPTERDLAKSVRELMGLAFYSNPDADWITSYERVWERASHFGGAGRLDVDTVALSKLARPTVFDPAEVVSVHYTGRLYDDAPFFPRGSGKKMRVAVIGSGAGGAVAAAKLAETGRYDVAVFEAGPRFRPGEYPLDTLQGMSQLFEGGLMTLSQDLDIHLLRGRLVGGGTVMTSGLSVRLRDETKRRWCSTNGDLAIGVGDAELTAGLDAVEREQAMGKINDTLYTGASGLLEEGARNLGAHEPKWVFDRDDARNNVMMRKGQHPRATPDQHGDYCIGCGLCNYGCHFGHKLSMDLSYLPRAERAGAVIHENAPVKKLVGVREDGEMRVRGLVVGRGKRERFVEVDAVVLAAGAVGTPALLLSTAEADPAWRALRPFRDELVGTGFGFNYGSGVIARWPRRFPKPGHLGFQIKYVATKESDPELDIRLPDGIHKTKFVLENAFVPPGLLSNLATGVGDAHLKWMERYEGAAMCATTIGSPQHGSVGADRTVRYSLVDDEVKIHREALASIARLYFAAGAEEVGLAGVREHPDDRVAPPGEGLRLRAEKYGQSTEAEIAKDLEQVIQGAEHLMLSSAHPQGGLRMSVHAERGAVDERFRLRDTANVFVSDASLFPSTIVVNPQWTIAALAEVAADRIARQLG